MYVFLDLVPRGFRGSERRNVVLQVVFDGFDIVVRDTLVCLDLLGLLSRESRFRVQGAQAWQVESSERGEIGREMNMQRGNEGDEVLNLYLETIAHQTVLAEERRKRGEFGAVASINRGYGSQF